MFKSCNTRSLLQLLSLSLCWHFHYTPPHAWVGNYFTLNLNLICNAYSFRVVFFSGTLLTWIWVQKGLLLIQLHIQIEPTCPKGRIYGALHQHTWTTDSIWNSLSTFSPPPSPWHLFHLGWHSLRSWLSTLRVKATENQCK